jgi:hypothetical protein
MLMFQVKWKLPLIESKWHSLRRLYKAMSG